MLQKWDIQMHVFKEKADATPKCHPSVSHPNFFGNQYNYYQSQMFTSLKDLRPTNSFMY